MNARSFVSCLTLTVSASIVNPSFADTTSDIIDAKPLIKLGAKNLNMRFEDPPNETTPQKTWLRKMVSFVSKISADPCQEQVERLKQLAVSGTMPQLEAFAQQEHVIFYPANYINIENVKALLTAGQKAAAKLNAAHKPALAAHRMRVCLEASKVLCYLEEQNGDKTAEPDKCIGAWSIDQVALPDSYWKPLLNDYANYLKARRF